MTRKNEGWETMTRLSEVKAERDHEHERAECLARLFEAKVSGKCTTLVRGRYQISACRLDWAQGGYVAVTYMSQDSDITFLSDWGTLDSVRESYARASLTCDDEDSAVLEALNTLVARRYKMLHPAVPA